MPERHEVVLKRNTTELGVQDHKQLELIAAFLVENPHGRKTFSTTARENLGLGSNVAS